MAIYKAENLSEVDFYEKLNGDSIAYCNLGNYDISTLLINISFFYNSNHSIEQWFINMRGTNSRCLSIGYSESGEPIGIYRDSLYDQHSHLWDDRNPVSYYSENNIVTNSLSPLSLSLNGTQYNSGSNYISSESIPVITDGDVHYIILNNNYLYPCKLNGLLSSEFAWDNQPHYADECGMWDLTTNKFYGNANSEGAFTVSGNKIAISAKKKISYLAYATSNNQLVFPKKLYWANSTNSVQLVYIRPELKENVDYVKYIWLKGSNVKSELNAPFIDSNYSILGKNEFEIEIIAQTEPPQKSIAWSQGNHLFMISPNTMNSAYINHSWIQCNGVWVDYGHGPLWNYDKYLGSIFYYHVNEKINIHVIRENNVNEIVINYNDGMSISVNNSNIQVQQIFDLINNVIIAKISDKIKVHFCKIVGYCELHPCKLLRAIHPFQASDLKIHYAGEAGMWDSMNNIFYGNANKSRYPFDVTNDSGVIAITNPSFYNYFSSYVTMISDIRFTNIIPNSIDVVDNNIIDITGEGSIIKSYMWLINNGDNDYIGYIGSEYYDTQNNNVFWVEGDISNIFRNLSKNEIDILEHFNFSYATKPYNIFYSSKVRVAGRESVINNMRKDLYWQQSFHYYLGKDGIDIAACDFKNKTLLFLWESANKFVNYENFDCSTMLSLNGFFYANTNLDFSSAIKNWNVSNVGSIIYLFANAMNEIPCVKYLNIENWDLRKCTESRYVFKHESVTNPTNEAFPDWIKTPAYSPQTAIDLVYTYYNADGTVYGNSIPANSVGSVRIYRTQDLAAQFNSAVTFVNKDNDNLTLVEYLENNTTYTIPTLEGYTAVVTDNNGNTYTDGDTITITQNITLTFVWTAVNNN